MNFNFFGRGKSNAKAPEGQPTHQDKLEDSALDEEEFDVEFDVEFDDEMDEETAEQYQEELKAQFFASPEGKARLEVDLEMGFWVEQFLHYGWGYNSVMPADMSLDDVVEIVSEIFPRKISLLDPTQADYSIPELITFWQFLQREFELAQAKTVLAYLQRIEPKFRRWMMDPSKAGMAKSIFMQSQAEGLDMTDPEQSAQFINAFNARLLAQPPELGADVDDELGLAALLGAPLPGATGNKKAKAVKKKARKMEKASRKANRKKRK